MKVAQFEGRHAAGAGLCVILMVLCPPIFLIAMIGLAMERRQTRKTRRARHALLRENRARRKQWRQQFGSKA